MDHVLLNCPFSASIWADVFRWFLIEQPLPLDVGSMIRFSIHQKNNKQVGNLWKAGVVSLLWSLWSHRNNVIHKNLAPSRHLILKQVRVFLCEAANNFVLGTMANSVSDLLILKNISIAGQPRKPFSYIYVAWHLPPPSWIKINTDGSVREGRIHAGGVFRNAFNDVLGCYHFSGGQGVAFEAELLAIIIAIESVHRAKWDRVWFESDSSYVVQLLQSLSQTVPWRFKPRWQLALSKLHTFTWRISHIFREGNRSADFLASQAREEGFWPHAIAGLIFNRELSWQPNPALGLASSTLPPSYIVPALAAQLQGGNQNKD
ncbi:uncharacterized protein LOC130998061 [Salvia miltiorrhiza]|uniref:uncharacterized protein LOC130998061 n=1 Tax=Salvia miltiorrhiza TaxID=226208 RepID=UPI0025AD77D2|nr:uncharacterized protein LOC130998061 [Salvia miltiorrhiza]